MRHRAAEQADEDAALAAALQHGMDLDHDREVRIREIRVNQRQHTTGNSRVSVSMANHYVHGAPQPRVGDSVDVDDSEVAVHSGAVWDKGVGQYRDSNGEIITKHNARESGARNAQILSDTASISEVGDLQGISLPTPVYNSIKKGLKAHESRDAARGLGCKGASDAKQAVGKVKAQTEGQEYGVEHGGTGNFDGLRIISAGAARSKGVQGW